MLAETRRDRIVTSLKESGQVTTDELATKLGVSVETIRRDLARLEERELLRRVHGGAVSTNHAVIREASYLERSRLAIGEKRAIARFVADIIPSDAVVFLDLGTTIDALTNELSESFSGTIVTTSLRIGMNLARLPQADVLMTGGRVRRDEFSLSGSTAIEILSAVHPDLAIISIGAIDVDAGITDYDFEELQLKKIMLKNATHSYVVADSTKFNHVATYEVCSVDEPYAIVTDSGLKDSQREVLVEMGANLLIAD